MLSLSGNIDPVQPVNMGNPLNSNLVAWLIGLPFNSGGSQFFDITGRNRHALLAANVPWGGAGGMSGNNNLAPIFADPNQQGTVIGNPLVGQSVYSVESVFFTGPTVSFAPYTLWNAYDNGVGDGIRLWGDGNPSAKIQFEKRTAYASVFATMDSALVPSTWYHMVGTCDAGLVTLYVNGQPQTTTGSGSAAALTNATNALVGTGTDTSGRSLMISHIALFAGRALTPGAVVARYNEARYGFPTLLNRVSPRAYLFPPPATSPPPPPSGPVTWRLKPNPQSATVWEVYP
jgi:hypothetical protein